MGMLRHDSTAVRPQKTFPLGEADHGISLAALREAEFGFEENFIEF